MHRLYYILHRKRPPPQGKSAAMTVSKSLPPGRKFGLIPRKDLQPGSEFKDAQMQTITDMHCVGQAMSVQLCSNALQLNNVEYI